MDAHLHVFTFREGLLGKLGHDLRLTLTRFSVTVRGGEVTGRFDLSSLRVDGAIQEGRVNAHEISPADRKKIESALFDDVLRTRECPEAVLTARTRDKRPPFQVQGQLTLAGVTRPLSFVLEEGASGLFTSLELKPSTFGIKPYKALGGALKVQDRIVISVNAHADWLKIGAELNPALELTWSAAQSSVRPPTRSLSPYSSR